MVTVPAFVWRYGPILRGLIVGVGVGVFLGALAWLDSGILVAGIVVFAVLSLFYGWWMARRMSRYWPSAGQLVGSERERVARAARAGDAVVDPRLGAALIDYRSGLHSAAADARPLRWLLWFVLVVAIATAVWDATSGSWGNAIVSVVYLALLALEVFWWPGRQQRLLANADRAVDMARESPE